MKSNSLSYAVKFMLAVVLIICSILAIGSVFEGALRSRADKVASASSKPASYRVLIIDAGHGGEDAGAVAEDQTLEKDLNLKISTLIKVLCDLNGTPAIMTRESDTLLYDKYDDLEDYTGHKKLYDLKNRVRFAEEYEDAVFISVHMNKFSQSQYSGMQIYYSKNTPQSEALARNIQDTTKKYLQPNNKRQIKPADSSIYVLNSINHPAVLVECGFLSNEVELTNLKSEQYQAKLALTIFASALPSL